VALETLGAMSTRVREFLTRIVRRLTEVTTDPRETAFLFQRLSVAVQRFNAACLADTFPVLFPSPHRDLSSFQMFLFLIFQPSGTEYRGSWKI